MILFKQQNPAPGNGAILDGGKNMTPFVSLLVCVIGIVLGMLGVTEVFRTKFRSRFWMVVGVLIFMASFWWGLAYDRKQNQKNDSLDQRSVE